MADRPAGTESGHYTVETYFGLVADGMLRPDDPVELLEGVVVAVAPQSVRHAAAGARTGHALRVALGLRATIREEKPIILQPFSAPEPDVCVVRGTVTDYDFAHPREALLIVEVADSSLMQDRLTKSRIYAAAAIPEYWILNLRDECVEVQRVPDPSRRLYADRRVMQRGDRISLIAFPDVSVAVDDLLPAPEPHG